MKCAVTGRFLRLSIPLAIIVALSGCSLKGKPKTASIPSTPTAGGNAPYRSVSPPPEPPYAEPQTRVSLPAPQPVNEQAANIVKPPEPVAQAQPPAPKPAKPVRVAQQNTPPAPVQPPPQEPPPPPQTAVRNRIRPVDSAAERQRLQREIEVRRAEAERIVSEVSSKPLSDAQKDIIVRVQGFLDQAAQALNDNDLRQADALSNRALLLSRDLPSVQ